MKKLIFVAAAMLWAMMVKAQNMDAILKNYMDVKNALVKSDDKAAGEAAISLQKSVSENTGLAKNDALKKSVNKLAEAKTLEKQRDAFYKVSANIWKEVKQEKKVGQPVYYQYCPMADGFWMSTEKNIENPYYGASMLKCGRVVEKKE